jgi:hypothetical protein
MTTQDKINSLWAAIRILELRQEEISAEIEQKKTEIAQLIQAGMEDAQARPPDAEKSSEEVEQ